MAPFGVWFTHISLNNIIGLLFAAVLSYVAWQMLKSPSRLVSTQKSQPQPCQINTITSKLFWTAACTARLTTTGCLAGLLSGLLGVGGSFDIVQALRKSSDFNMETIITTSLAVIALVSASGFLSYIAHDRINWQIALPFGASAMIGMFMSSLFTNKIPAKINLRDFAVLAFIVAIALAIKHL